MPTTRPAILDEDPAGRDQLWQALTPESDGPQVRVRAVMIASIDGSTTVDGRSGGLGTPTDKLVYDAMRARADVVMVGSGTALAEGYGDATISADWADRRSRPAPPVLVLTRTLPTELVDLGARARGGIQIAATTSTPPSRIDAARDAGVTVHVLDDASYSNSLLGLLAGLGAGEVAFEGGPNLLGRFLTEGLVHELILSIAPEIIVGGHGPGLVPGDGSGAHRIPMRVANVFSCPRGGLYTRWVNDAAAGNDGTNT
ncbi:MAG: hypothetical protein GX636_08505 [Actinomycetales bacterium]|nr:hypothetical protein [Actinomycetales bacterium]